MAKNPICYARAHATDAAIENNPKFTQNARIFLAPQSNWTAFVVYCGATIGEQDNCMHPVKM
jgi:hypothetical protein